MIYIIRSYRICGLIIFKALLKKVPKPFWFLYRYWKYVKVFFFFLQLLSNWKFELGHKVCKSTTNIFLERWRLFYAMHYTGNRKKCILCDVCFLTNFGSLISDVYIHYLSWFEHLQFFLFGSFSGQKLHSQIYLETSKIS